MNAMGKKNPQELQNALRDFEAVPKTEKMKQDDRDLVAAAKAQIDSLKKQDGTHLCQTFQIRIV